MTKNILVIGDAHVNLNSSNRRFTALGNFILDKRPDVIVDIGDWCDFNTLGKYDKGSKASWGKTFKDECDLVRDANAKAFGRISRFTKYKPRIIRTLGNHEQKRINEFLHKYPELEGIVSLDYAGLSDYNCEVHDFLTPVTIDNVTFCHYFYNKDNRYSIGNAKAVLQTKMASTVWGHSHVKDFAESVDAKGNRFQAVNVGCYLDPEEMGVTYAGWQGMHRWWSGLTMLNDVTPEGNFDVSFHSTTNVFKEYL
jgi:predicted phosphodiesterase